MRALISAVRTVVAYPSRWATNLADWRAARAEKREADIQAHVDWIRQMHDRVPYEVRPIRQRKPQTRKEAA